MVKTTVKEKKMVPVSAAAKFLEVSIDTIRRWDKSGKLHSERLNGKDRFFSLEELEEIKFAKPLSISEVAMQLKISPATLRRLEKRGLISPKRTESGERAYDRDAINRFLESEYFLGKRKIKEEVFEPLEKRGLNKNESTEDITLDKEIQHLERREPVENVKNTPGISTEPSENMHLGSNLKPLQRIPEIAVITIVFLVLVTVGLRNINALPHRVLGSSETPVVTPAPSPIPSPVAEEEKKAKAMLVVKIDDISASSSAQVNIRQKPTVNSEKIGTARDGDTFEFFSVKSGWYEVKLATGSGFISGAFIKTGGENK